MQGKQAKIVSPTQERAIVGYLDTTRYPARDRVMFLLSMKGFFAQPLSCGARHEGRHAESQIMPSFYLSSLYSSIRLVGSYSPSSA